MSIVAFLLSIIVAVFVSLGVHPRFSIISICIVGAFLVYTIDRKSRKRVHAGIRAISCFFLSGVLGVFFFKFLGADDLLLIVPVFCCVGSFLMSSIKK